MKRPTIAEAEQAAELLGIDAWELGNILRDAAVAEIQEAARRVNMHEPLEVGRARRLLAAADACKKAALDVEAAKAS